MEIFALKNKITQLFYARSANQKYQLIGVDDCMNFIVLEPNFSTENDLEFEE